MTVFGMQNRSRRLHTVAWYVELGICGVLVALFVVLQLSSTVWLVSDFNWINFIDFDDGYQVEQFLGNINVNSVEGLPNWIWAYGSEFFLLIPIYKLIAALSGGPNPLGAFYFLKIIHILAAAVSVVVLRRLLERAGTPALFSWLVIGIVVSSPLFFAYAHSLKPDVNVVLFLLVAGFWALLKFDERGERKWFLASVALASLAAAVKWWGLFLLMPQFDLVARRYVAGEPFKPLIGARRLLIINAVACGLLIVAVAAQGTLFMGASPRALVKVALVGSGAVALLLACVAVVSVVGARLLAERERASVARAPWKVTLASLLYHFVLTGSLFAAGYVVFAAPFLLSDQLVPSVNYFSRSLLLSSARGVATETLWSSVLANISGWIYEMVRVGFLPVLLAPGLVVSCVVLSRKKERRGSYRALQAVGTFTAVFLIFLTVFVAKKNEATMAMLLPFLVMLAVAPVAIWARQLVPIHRNLVLGALLFLGTGQAVLQAKQTREVISSYGRTIQTIASANGSLIESLARVTGVGENYTLFISGREFPVHSDTKGVKYLTGDEYVELLERLVGICDRRHKVGFSEYKNNSSTFILVDTSVGSSFSRYQEKVERLKTRGCLNLVSEIHGISYRRGVPWRFSFASYRIRSV